MVADGLVIGGGLAGLVATAELAAAGRPVIVLDGEPRQALSGQALSGQAHWSLGGLCGVDTTEYPDGVVNHAPLWSRHGIRIRPGPSSISSSISLDPARGAVPGTALPGL